MFGNLVYFVLPVTSGVLAGYFAGLYGTLFASAGMFLLIMLWVQNLEVPQWQIGLAVAGLAALGGLVGTLLGALRRAQSGKAR